uniref:SERTA domain-containing protein n=1 Tax=Amphilophus citrinellus TaxID=61819 RepID=A0A3Q0RGW9_AMPCI
MTQRGEKRKLWTEEEASDSRGPTWESQRQFVFAVSLNKYRCGQQLREPSLRRSVLIANTLRQISLQVSAEVSQPPGTSSPALSATLASCPAVSLNYSSDSSEKTNDEDWGSMSTDTDSSLSVVISSILAALDSTIDGNPQAASRTPLRPLENMSRPYEGGVTLDLFQDIDTSLVDMDMGGIGPSLMRLPSPSSSVPVSSSSSSCQNDVRERFYCEHLMKILVETF